MMASTDFPLPKRGMCSTRPKQEAEEMKRKESLESRQWGEGVEYDSPKIASNLKSFRARWEALQSRLPSSPSREEQRQMLLDVFNRDLCLGKIRVQRDTSICRRYSATGNSIASRSLPIASKRLTQKMRKRAAPTFAPVHSRLPVINVEPLVTLSRNQSKLGSESMIAREGNRGAAPLGVPVISQPVIPPVPAGPLSSLVAYAAAKTEAVEAGIKPPQTVTSQVAKFPNSNKRRRIHRSRAA